MDILRMNNVPFIAGMRATPRRIVKSFFIATVMGFLVINMNLLLRSVEDDSTAEYAYQGDPNYMGRVDPHRRGGNGVEPIEPNNLRHHPRINEQPSLGNQKATGSLDNNNSNNDAVKTTLPKVQILPNNSSDLKLKTGANTALPNKGQPQPTPSEQKNATHAPVPQMIQDLLKGPHNPVNPQNASFIKDLITTINHEQKIHNLDKFDLSSSGDTVVIVIQVHNRANYLRHVLASLKKARHIEQTLLIFSHDFYDPEIMEVVQHVDFCPMMQIFFPFPNQIYTNEYPGEDPGDCPRDVKKDEAVRRGCINANWPDKYGHYREAKYAQTKHHWFWKINHVFDHLEVTRHHKGPVLFIEEDHYLVPDFIYVLNKMFKFSHENCKECGIFTLGTYDKNPTYTGDASKGLVSWLFGGEKESLSYLETTDWVSNKHNMGMALKRDVWEKVKKCHDAFCRFDDYNWDWSLQFTSFTCVPGRLKVMLSKSPRIFHIGECGVHHKGKNCNPEVKVQQLEELLKRNSNSMFPSKLVVAGRPRSAGRTPKPNGGWGDKRDYELCKSFVLDETHR